MDLIEKINDISKNDRYLMILRNILNNLSTTFNELQLNYELTLMHDN